MVPGQPARLTLERLAVFEHLFCACLLLCTQDSWLPCQVFLLVSLCCPRPLPFSYLKRVGLVGLVSDQPGLIGVSFPKKMVDTRVGVSVIAIKNDLALSCVNACSG